MESEVFKKYEQLNIRSLNTVKRFNKINMFK